MPLTSLDPFLSIYLFPFFSSLRAFLSPPVSVVVSSSSSAFQAVRCQVLDYFVRQREGLREDHVLFSFEQSMAFSKAEFALTDQVGLYMLQASEYTPSAVVLS